MGRTGTLRRNVQNGFLRMRPALHRCDPNALIEGQEIFYIFNPTLVL